MPRFRSMLLLTFVFSSSTLLAQTSSESTKTPNEVVVMGMIHRSHRQPGPFDLGQLKNLMRKIKPDYVLTEIPPDRLETAARQYRESGTITESRVRVFPEYTDALFPLTKEMDFKIIACAGWTKAMNDSRNATLAKLRKSHAKQFAEMSAAQQAAGEHIAAIGDRNDPVVIHTDRFDAFVEDGMEPYDRHFNDLIGPGGWANINAAHYGHIADALDKHAGEGKRFLITFGSWHKNYIKKQLRKRTDIKIIPMSDYLKTTHPTPAEWTQFRGNANRTGTYGQTEISQPVVAWQYDTGDVIESSAAVVGDTVYIGGHANRLHAIDRITGDLKWKFDVGGLVRASPSVANGMVYFGADDNRFYAVDAETGEKKWEFKLGDGGEQSSPAIVDGIVYFGGFDNHVYALNAATGEQVWKRDVGASMLSSPFVTSDSVYIGTYGGKLFALKRDSGEVRWEFHKNDEPIFASPVVSDELIYFTSYDHHIYAVQTANGEVSWKHKTAGQIFSSPVIDDGTLYVGSNDKHLYALDAASGDSHWKANLGGAVFSSPAVTEKSIYVGSSDGHMYALQRANGAVRWKHSVGKDVKVWTSPTASQGRLYFGSHAGQVIVLKDKE